MNSTDTILYYEGPFDDKVLSEIGNKLRNKAFIPPKIRKKLFSIFIELAQNISRYSSEVKQSDDTGKRWGVGTVLIEERSHSYYLKAKNLVRKENLIRILEKCREINTQDREGLRAMKRAYRSSASNIRHKGGNIGLIQVALQSGCPLTIGEKEVDENHSLFSLSVNIEK